MAFLFIYALYRKSDLWVFPEIKLFPNSYIHVSVSDPYIPRDGLPIWLQQNRQTDPGNILIAHRYMNGGNWETEH